MRLNEVLVGKSMSIHPILEHCSEFLKESEGYPVVKNLPSKFKDIQKLKLRQRKKHDKFTKTFNETFNNTHKLKQRSISVNGKLSFDQVFTENKNDDLFYVFPIDGYKYMYSLEVTNSKEDYQEAFEHLIHVMGDKSAMKDLLKYTYTDVNLLEGIHHGSEIIFYNMPYCYIARESIIESYSEFLLSLEDT